MNIWDNFIYFYHLDKFCILPSTPDTITDSMTSTYRDVNALSRSAPVQSYIQSGPRTITFNINLHRDIMEDLNTDVSNLKDNVVDFADKDYIDVLINYLQARALPKYNVYKVGSKVVDPPQVAIKMGNDIFIRGVVSGSVSVTYKKPILDNGKYAAVDVTIPVTEIDPYDAPTVVMKGGFRGVTSTFKNGIFKGEEDSIAYSGQEYTSITTSTESTTLNTNNSISRARAENAAYNNNQVTRDSSLTQRKIPSQTPNIFETLGNWLSSLSGGGIFDGISSNPFEGFTEQADYFGVDVGVIPLTDAGWVTKPFTWDGKSSDQHKGIDIGVTRDKYRGCSVLAWQDGVVQECFWNDSMGWCLCVRHDYPKTKEVRWTAYIHLRSNPRLHKGDTVYLGQPMKYAQRGNTGSLSNGEHLHFYLTKRLPSSAATNYNWNDTLLKNCIDPMPYLYYSSNFNKDYIDKQYWKKELPATPFKDDLGRTYYPPGYDYGQDGSSISLEEAKKVGKSVKDIPGGNP